MNFLLILIILISPWVILTLAHIRAESFKWDLKKAFVGKAKRVFNRKIRIFNSSIEKPLWCNAESHTKCINWMMSQSFWDFKLKNHSVFRQNSIWKRCCSLCLLHCGLYFIQTLWLFQWQRQLLTDLLIVQRHDVIKNAQNW